MKYKENLEMSDRGNALLWWYHLSEEEREKEYKKNDLSGKEIEILWLKLKKKKNDIR